MVPDLKAFVDEVEAQIKTNAEVWGVADANKTKADFILIGMEQLGQAAIAFVKGDPEAVAMEIEHTVAVLFVVWRRCVLGVA